MTNPHTTPQHIDELAEQAYKLLSTNYEEMFNLLEPLQQKAQAINYSLGLAYYHYLRGAYYYAKSDLSPGLTHTLQALQQLPAADIPPLWLTRFYARLAVIYMLLGSFAEALNYGFLALNSAEKLPPGREKLLALVNLGAIYHSFKEFNNALTYLEQALEFYKAHSLPYMGLYALCLINFAEVYEDLKAYDKAAECDQTILEIAPKISSPYEQKRMNYAALLNLAHISIAQHEPEKAVSYAQNILAQAESDDHFIQIRLEAMSALVEAFIQLNEYQEALKRVKIGVELAQTAQFLGYEYQFYEKEAQIQAHEGQFKEAFEAYQKYHLLKEQVFSEENQKKVQNLEVLHQTELAKKEAALYAELYQEEQHRRKLAETLREVGTLITSSLELEQVLEKILNYLADLVPNDQAVVLRLEGKKLALLAMSGEDSNLHQHPKIELNPAETKILWHIYEHQQPYKIDNLADEPNWTTNNLVKDPVSWLGIPLVAYGEFKGVLTLFRYTHAPFSAEEIQTATVFASSAVVALENAQLFAQIKRFNEHLEYEVNQRTQALRSAYEQLEKLDRAKGDFIAITAHELRTPITVIQGYGQILQYNQEVMSHGNSAEVVRGIVSGASRLHEIVNTMLLMVKIDNRELKVHHRPVSLHTMLERVVGELKADLADRHQMVVLEPAVLQFPQVSADSDLLQLVFYQLLMNAIKYTPDGRSIILSGRSWTENPPQPDWPPSGVEIVVTDMGIGIPAEALDLIFTKFYQTGRVANHSSGKTKFKAGGPGLGLALVRGIVEAHHGRIWAESQGYNEQMLPGSQFHVVLPV